MGGSKSPSSTSTTTTGLPPWLQPYAEHFIQSYAGQAFDVDPATGAYNLKPQDPALQQQNAGFTPAQLQSQNMIMNQAGPAQGLANLAGAENARTMSGQYLAPGMNPYLDATYNAAAGGVSRQFQNATLPGVMAAAQRAGQFGSSGMKETMGDAAFGFQHNLQDMAANIYGGNYQAERGRMGQAVGQNPATMAGLYAPAYQVGGVGAQQQNQQQAEYDTSYMNAVQRAEYPFNILSGFGGALGQAGSGAGTSQTSTKGSASSGFLGK